VSAQRRAIGSAGERLVHTEEVTGSIPVSPTQLTGQLRSCNWPFLILMQQQSAAAWLPMNHFPYLRREGPPPPWAEVWLFRVDAQNKEFRSFGRKIVETSEGDVLLNQIPLRPAPQVQRHAQASSAGG
jgi:hypothetical protein